MCRVLVLVLVCSALVGCSGNGGVTKGDSHGPYPAPHPPLPQIDKGPGDVAGSPKLVAITYANDALRPDVEKFVSVIGQSAYWSEVTSEYGVGKAIAQTPVELPDPAPATITDGAIQNFLQSVLDGNHPEYGPPDSDTIYAFFFPETTQVTQSGQQSCQAFGGYHSSVNVQYGIFALQAAYAVIPRCPGFYQVASLLDATTAVASHELIEAATDPEPNGDPAYASVSNDDYAWNLLLNGGEPADMCVYPHAASPFFKPDDLPYVVQRSWSNAAADAGENPCIPAQSGPYFNAMPVLPDTVTLQGIQGVFTARGVKIAPGESRTIEVRLFSTAATNADWDVSAVDYGTLYGHPPELQLQFDRTSGQNGDVLNLTITVKSPGPSGGEPFLVKSRLGNETNFAAGLVGQ